MWVEQLRFDAPLSHLQYAIRKSSNVHRPTPGFLSMLLLFREDGQPLREMWHLEMVVWVWNLKIFEESEVRGSGGRFNKMTSFKVIFKAVPLLLQFVSLLRSRSSLTLPPLPLRDTCQGERRVLGKGGPGHKWCVSRIPSQICLDGLRTNTKNKPRPGSERLLDSFYFTGSVASSFPQSL